VLVLLSLRLCRSLHLACHLAGGRRIWCWLAHCHHLGEEKSGSWTVRAEREVNTWPNLRATMSRNQHVMLCATGITSAQPHQAGLLNIGIDCTEGKVIPSPSC
jgi:hypothetical protein